MTLDDAQKLIPQGESHTVEFKKSTARLKSAFETACAFLNSDGGTILIGVTDDQQCLGQEVSDKTKREIGNHLARITPTPICEIDYIPLSKKAIKWLIAITAYPDHTKQPYSYNGRAFIRIQSDTLPMPREYYQQLTISNATKGNAWEDQIPLDISINDLDIEEILATVKAGTTNGRIPENYTTDDPWIALQHLGLIINDKITNAAVVLFGKNPEKWFPQCILKLARFRGINKDEFIDNKRVTGHAFKLLREAIAFANSYLPIASTFPTNSVERVDTPLFPILVLREALANALCHRDYAYRGGSLAFAIFDDRIEIWNYGLLPNGVTLEELKNLNQSVPRNLRVANVFYYHKITETWGRGINMILNLCTEAGHPEPVYTQVAGGTLLTLYSKQPIGSTLVKLEAKTPTLLTTRQEEIINTIRQFNLLSTKELQGKMTPQVPERTLRLELNRLKAMGFIDASGHTTTRKWHLTEVL